MSFPLIVGSGKLVPGTGRGVLVEDQAGLPGVPPPAHDSGVVREGVQSVVEPRGGRKRCQATGLTCAW